MKTQKSSRWRWVPGVYVIWSKDRKRAYVGETCDLANRMGAHRVHCLLSDCVIRVVKRLPPGTRWQVRRLHEGLVIERLRKRGVRVVNTER